MLLLAIVTDDRFGLADEAKFASGDFALSIHELTYFRRAIKVFGLNFSKSISTLASSSQRNDGSEFCKMRKTFCKSLATNRRKQLNMLW